MLGTEICTAQVVIIGRLVGNPVPLPGGEVHFQIGSAGETPFHCFFPAGKDADALLRYKQDKDEISLEGVLVWRKFRNEPKPTLLIQGRHASYGRKSHSLSGR